MIRLLFFGALASLAAGGLSAASALQVWKGGRAGYGFTAGNVLELLAALPEIVVLFALLRLAIAASSPHLYRSSQCLYIAFWFVDLVSVFFSKSLSEGLMIVLGISMLLGVLAILIFRIWFAVALIRARDRLGGIAGVLGVVIMLNAGAWVVLRSLMLLSDDASAFDWADSARSLIGIVLIALLLFLLFLGVRDRLIEGSR
jgi:hypothetical protein